MLELLRADRYRRMSWKNGRGTTTEIARFPPAEEGSEAPFEWRVSVADVPESGSFSQFPGVDRTILALDGAGMVLSHPELGTSVTLDALEPYAFPGDVATECTLRGGPLRDFNVMVRRGTWRAEVVVLRLEPTATAEIPPGVVLVLVVAGAVSVVTAGAAIGGGPFESFRLDGEASATIASSVAGAGAVAIAVVLHRT